MPFSKKRLYDPERKNVSNCKSTVGRERGLRAIKKKKSGAPFWPEKRGKGPGMFFFSRSTNFKPARLVRGGEKDLGAPIAGWVCDLQKKDEIVSRGKGGGAKVLLKREGEKKTTIRRFHLGGEAPYRGKKTTPLWKTGLQRQVDHLDRKGREVSVPQPRGGVDPRLILKENKKRLGTLAPTSPKREKKGENHLRGARGGGDTVKLIFV